MNIKFKEQIFMGNGRISMAEAYHLHTLLENTLENISDIQQEGGMGYSPNEKNIELSENQIQRNVKQIVMALTGKQLPKRFFND
jgi:hypothetical protein